MKKLIEMLYPYVLSVVIFVLFKFVKNSLYQSKNINDALDAVITVSSLIIGFLGAVLPVIMSMKNGIFQFWHICYHVFYCARTDALVTC